MKKDKIKNLAGSILLGAATAVIVMCLIEVVIPVEVQSKGKIQLAGGGLTVIVATIFIRRFLKHGEEKVKTSRRQAEGAGLRAVRFGKDVPEHEERLGQS